jgi:Family of unknown function (DUF6221)
VSDLIAFLKARLDEGGFFARQGAGWATGSRYEGQPQGWVDYLRTVGSPEFALALIGAQRAIISLHAVSVSRQERRPLAEDVARGDAVFWEDEYDCPLCGWFAAENGACLTVRHLAAPYSAHPDYDPAWAPEAGEAK